MQTLYTEYAPFSTYTEYRIAGMLTGFYRTADSKYRPSVLLGRMVDAGFLGKKSGKGFFDY